MEEKRTKLYVFTGFLGAGKTTVLSRILQESKEEKIGVIQNEFGKLGIDGEILKHNDIQMVEINRGSIFCSCLKLQFVQALSEMAQYEFDKLFVESSGLGDPSNVEEILKASEMVSGRSYDLFRGFGKFPVTTGGFRDSSQATETLPSGGYYKNGFGV